MKEHLRITFKMLISVLCGVGFYIFWDYLLNPSFGGWVILVFSAGMITIGASNIFGTGNEASVRSSKERK